ncbi:aromatic amino acid lyase [candidate division WOR-3 bacterium]|nr:aromatic amino acid lyase [candidate division WOR-3 bacterium]
MAVTFTGKNLTVEDIERVARHNESIEIAQEAWDRIARCRAMCERKIEAGEVMYGVTTGVGDFSEVVLTPEQTREFQRYFIYAHAAGFGEPLPQEVARAALATRINVLCNGLSGCRPVIVETLAAMLNRGVNPVMCKRGSVGACGDLAPMAQAGLVLMGKGEAFYKDERLPGAEAMRKAQIPVISYEARDGLAILNGANVISGWGSLMLPEAIRWLKHHDIACAMTMEALNVNTKCLDERLHQARGYPGAIAVASNLRKIVKDSRLLERAGKRVQDAYSLRSAPQVAGAARDSWAYARRMFEIELNGVGDNPLFFPDSEEVLTGANFQGTPLAFALEALGLAISTVCVLSERRLNRLMNPALSQGLPAFLTKGGGMFTGLMISQYTCCQLVNEQRVLTNPAANGSIPAAADQEDFVSMGMTTAIKTSKILDFAYGVLGIELIAAAQAFDFRNAESSPVSKAAYEVIRSHVKHLDEDRPLFTDHNRMAEVIRTGEILNAVEKVVGHLD